MNKYYKRLVQEQSNFSPAKFKWSFPRALRPDLANPSITEFKYKIRSSLAGVSWSLSKIPRNQAHSEDNSSFFYKLESDFDKMTKKWKTRPQHNQQKVYDHRLNVTNDVPGPGSYSPKLLSPILQNPIPLPRKRQKREQRSPGPADYKSSGGLQQLYRHGKGRNLITKSRRFNYKTGEGPGPAQYTLHSSLQNSLGKFGKERRLGIEAKEGVGYYRVPSEFGYLEPR